jgi:hypothetical protein
MAVDSNDVTAGTNAVFTQYNNLRGDLVLGKNTYGEDADGATITIDWSDKTKGKIRTIVLGGNRTIVFTNPVKGQTLTIRFVQDATGGRSITLPAGITYPGGSAPPLSTGANQIDIFTFICSETSPSVTYDMAIVTMGNS